MTVSPTSSATSATENSDLRSDHLRPVTGRPTIPRYISQIWDRRYFIRAEAKAKVYAGSKNLILGRAWLVLSPLLDAAVYGLVFGVFLNTSRGIEHFIPYLLVGIAFFSFTNRSFNGGSGLMTVRKNFIKAFAFPRAALVFSHSLKFFYDTLPVVAVTLLLILFFPQGIGVPPWTWLLFPLAWVWQIIFNTGLMFFSAAATHKIPDLKQLFPYLTRFWFYASGVFFSIDAFIGNHHLLGTILKLNPAYVNLSIMRDLLVYGRVPDAALWGLQIGWAIGVFLIGFVIFWSREIEYARG